MSFVNKSYITVFPNAERAAANPTTQNLKARKMTEENTVGIIKHTLDQESYVISSDTSGNFEFVIDGYYVEIDSGHIPSERPLYAGIKVESVNDYPELRGVENGDNYEGVTFSNNQTISDTTSVLQLLDSSGNVPISSRKKFTPDRLDFSQIAYIGGITV